MINGLNQKFENDEFQKDKGPEIYFIKAHLIL